jgi:NAD-dependent dihydropyrimidine dehydrogenase PreA subunit/DNA-binding transcriptional regulator YhcF (GntR family)
MAKIEPVYQEVATKISTEENKALPRLVKKIANLEQANMMLELPGTTEAIAKKLAVDKNTVSKNLQYLYERGLVTSGRKGWALVNNLVLVKDSVGSAPYKYDDDEVFDLTREMSLESSKSWAGRIKKGEKITPPRQGMRVVPKWRSIKDIPGVLPIEDVRQIFKDNFPIVVHRCPCRSVYRNRPCKDDIPLDVCIGAGAAGKRNLRRGSGKELTYDELIAFLDKLDEFPLVTMVGNSDRMPSAICSCCQDCCGVFVRTSYTKPLFGQVTYAKSRFVVEDNPEECTACGICTDNRCPVNAITMKDFPKLGGQRSYTNVDECIGCGLCVLTCPNEARKMKLVRPPNHIPSTASMFDPQP